jgi:PepSY-associated TM region
MLGPMTRRLHRFLGLSLAMPLVLWMATGVLFHVKYRYAEAYESLQALRRGTADLSRFTVSAARAAAGDRFEKECVPRFAVRPDGRGAWFGRKDGKGVGVDAATGELLSPASEEISVEWARAAVAASPNAARYGAPLDRSAARDGHPSSLTLSQNPSLDLSFSGGKTLTVDRLTGEIVQSGALNDWIDFTYRVHYMQWTPWKGVNVALVLVAVPLVLGLAVSGLRMAFGWDRRGRIGT